MLEHRYERRTILLAALGIGAYGPGLEHAHALCADIPRHLDPAFAAFVTSAVYEAVTETALIPQKDFQKEFFLLRQREFDSLKKADFANLSCIKQAGDIGQAPYFNFVSYIQWKVISRHVGSGSDLSALTSSVGRRLLQYLSSAALPPFTSAQVMGSSSVSNSLEPEGRPALATVQKGVESVLQRLVDTGYITGFYADWGDSDDSEWTRAHSAGFELKLKAPVDISAASLLRAESSGFSQCTASSILEAFFQGMNINSDVDEYFFQEKWQPPRTIGERLLLALGDPLQSVVVPYDPDNILQVWRISSS